MVELEDAQTEMRKLSQLKDYPRSWGESDPVRADQQTRAELSLVEAAAEAPSLSTLRRFTLDWMRRHIEAPKPANLYAAWHGPESPTFETPRRTRCAECSDAGWVTRFFVVDAIAGTGGQRIPITAAEVDDWWERIRKAGPTCAQRVYEEAGRCRCQKLGTIEHARKAAGDL